MDPQINPDYDIVNYESIHNVTWQKSHGNLAFLLPTLNSDVLLLCSQNML